MANRARALHGVERITYDGAENRLYRAVEKPGGPVQAAVSARPEGKNSWRLDLDVIRQPTEGVLAETVAGAAADACVQGASEVVLRPGFAPFPNEYQRNIKAVDTVAEFYDLTCRDKDDQGRCTAYAMSTKTSGRCSPFEFTYSATSEEERSRREQRAARKRRKAKQPGEQTKLFRENKLGPRTPTAPMRLPQREIDATKEERAAALHEANKRKSKRCKVLAKEKAYRIVQCGPTFYAKTPKGSEIGHLDLADMGGGQYRVALSTTSEGVRGQKVGQALYEAAADSVCAMGGQLVSDTTRSRYSENFWRKQERKGRAECLQEASGRTFTEAYELVYGSESLSQEARNEYINSRNLEREAARELSRRDEPLRAEAVLAYASEYGVTERDIDPDIAVQEYVFANDFQSYAADAYFQENPDELTYAIQEYIEENEAELEVGQEEEPADYYASPWFDTEVSYEKRIEAAREKGDEEKAEELEMELADLDDYLPMPDDYNNQWPCRRYGLTREQCQKEEIDLGKVPSKGLGAWAPPKSQSARSAFAQQHGKRCFLRVRTSKRGGKPYYSYPVCDAKGKFSCLGSRSAYQRALQQGDRKTAAKAKRQAKAGGCEWAQKKSKKTRKR